MLYLEDKYALTSEKKIQKAISIIADCNKYHPIRDYLNSLEWDGTERIRYALSRFLGADENEYVYKKKSLHASEQERSRCEGETQKLGKEYVWVQSRKAGISG